MEATYTPYSLQIIDNVPTYTAQIYPSDYPVKVVGGVTITPGTTPMSILLKNNITEFADEPANKGTFEYAGVFQDVPLFFMKVNKGATMTFKITCNAYSSLPLFLKYCNSWGKLSVTETEFYGTTPEGEDLTGITREFYVTLEPTITEKPVNFGKTQFDITLKFTRVQV